MRYITVILIYAMVSTSSWLMEHYNPLVPVPPPHHKARANKTASLSIRTNNLATYMAEKTGLFLCSHQIFSHTVAALQRDSDEMLSPQASGVCDWWLGRK